MVLVAGNNNLPLCNQTADFLRVHAFLFRHNFHLRCDDTLSCRVHLCCVHIRFLLVHVAPNFAVLLFFCVGLWCMQPATEGSNPHPWTIKKLHYAKNIAQLPRVNSMSLRWHYPNQVYGSRQYQPFLRRPSTSSRRVCAQEISILDTPLMENSTVSEPSTFPAISATACVLAKIIGPVI